MAEVKVTKQSSEERKGGQELERRGGGGLLRRGEFLPSILSLSPREFFSMSPFQLMRRFSEEMDRAFMGFGGREERWSPAIDVYERDNKLFVTAELPGLNKDDIKVEVTDEGLVLQGERKREEKEERQGYYRSERSYGQFYRLIPLPEDAKIDEAHAQFNNGVLEISIPIPEAQKKRREIPVETGERSRTSGGGGA